MSNEIEEKFQELKKAFRIFSGPLVLIDHELTYDYPDINEEFDIFEAIFNETFETKLKKRQALTQLENIITKKLGFKLIPIYQDENDMTMEFDWSNLVKYKVSGNYPPQDDWYWANRRSGYDGELHEETGFDEKTEELVIDLLDKLKKRFSLFKEKVLGEILKNSPQKGDDISDSEITEMIAYFNLKHAELKWKYFFKDQNDVETIATMLIKHFKKIEYTHLNQPIQNKNRRTIPLAKVMNEIYRDKSVSKTLKQDHAFLRLLQRNLSAFEGRSFSQLCEDMGK
ncbi:MAG: hypothetical protein WAT79_11265 [Saprospiraceae bacterium]